MVVHLTCNEKVVGSNPSDGSVFIIIDMLKITNNFHNFNEWHQTNNLVPFNRYMICEKYGILQYNDMVYDNIIKRVENQINRRLKDNNAKYKYHIIFSDFEYSCQKLSINFDGSSLGWSPRWIRQLDIYFTKFAKPDLYYCFVIGDVTWKDEAGNPIGIYCDVMCGETKMEPLIIKDGVIEHGSIFVASGDENFDYLVLYDTN